MPAWRQASRYVLVTGVRQAPQTPGAQALMTKAHSSA